MRSIRRSLLGYLLLLLGLALGAMALFVDRFAEAAMRDREEAEVRRTEQALALRRHEARVKFEAELRSETKSLARELNTKVRSLIGDDLRRPGGGPPPGPRVQDPALKATQDESKAFNLRRATLPLLVPDPRLRTAVVALAEPPLVTAPRPPGAPRPVGDQQFRALSLLWTAYDAPRAFTRIQEALKKWSEDEERPGFYQFQLVASFPGHAERMTAEVVSPRLGEPMPRLSDSALDRGPDADLENVDEVEVGGQRLVRAAAVRAGGRSLTYGVWITPPSEVTSLPARASLAPRLPDLFLRVVVHHARPYSELSERLAADEQDRDEQLVRVRDEIRRDLTQLRSRLAVIGAASFAALVIGGWLIVARGLRPLGRLCEAVSRVSEKDFNLPHDGRGLPAELAPIHARLTQTLDLLRRAFSREKQAVADISHELRTPIAALMATIDVALRKPRTPEQYRDTLEECRLISKQLSQLVERIMTLASLDAGNDHTHFARTDAVDLACGCAAVIRPLAAANGVKVALHVDEPIELDTDAGKLREVLMNLLHNAVEYNQPEGTIDLTARRDNGSAVFEVRDSGIGMPPEVQEKIFERFYRADTARHATGVHAGLGLAIVKEYVARLNGRIAVESTPGRGSTFRVTLPMPAEPTENPDGAPADEPLPAIR